MTREEAIKAIKAWDFLNKDEKEAIETLIPELKESEDERISREITEFILTHRIDEPNDIEDTNSWLVWLEKQGEPKWSEEDDGMVACIKSHLRQSLTSEAYTSYRQWLESLKQRMEEQQ